MEHGRKGKTKTYTPKTKNTQIVRLSAGISIQTMLKMNFLLLASLHFNTPASIHLPFVLQLYAIVS